MVSDDLYQGSSVAGSNDFFSLFYGMISIVKLIAPVMVLLAIICIGYFLFRVNLSKKESRPLFVSLAFLLIDLLCRIMVNTLFI